MTEPPPSTSDPTALQVQLLQKRLERAEEHFTSFGRIWADYLDVRPHGLERASEADGTVSIRLRRAAPLPIELSIVFGELLYELRAALDNCLYAVAVIISGQNPPPSANRLEWPIRLTPGEWKNQVGRYRDLPPEIVDALEAIQPYQAELPGWNCLGILHDLARIDRHRSPHGLGLYLSHVSLATDPSHIEILSSGHPGIVKEGDEIVRIRLTGAVALSPENFDLNLEFEVDVTDVRESLGPGGYSGRPWGPLDERLRSLIRASHQYTSELLEIAATCAARPQ